MSTMTSRYVVGIDLGTTHCSLSYVDTQESTEDRAVVHTMVIPQLVSRGAVDSLPLLPSFLYLAHESDGPQALPWDATRTYAVGSFARSRGAEAPNRLVSSAKSWLCHPSIDRRAAVLPLQPADDIEKVSPVEATFRYLDHLVEAWNAQIAHGDPALALGAQEVILTVPASFDASARELTAEAAVMAGLDHLTLLEEPQAALYAWLDSTHGSWRKQLIPGDLLLVVDIGGGTTDFSAIAVVDAGGSLELQRVAVGDHILLGGDNMDLALSFALQAKLKKDGKDLDAWQRGVLVHAARSAKELLLSETSVTSAPVVIPGRGAKLLGGAIRTELGRDELNAVLIEGFFPRVEPSARPVVRPRAGLAQMGLPYASDAAIPRHLAAFLGRQNAAVEKLAGFGQGGMLRPTAVLFNGGVMKGERLRERLLETLRGWVEGEGGALRVLEGNDLDLAVARGAAAYGFSRRGKGVRIRGGTARSYYVGIESPMPAVPGFEPPITALCVAPFGMEEGTRVELPPQELAVVVGEPVRFRFFSSSSRRKDLAGGVLESWADDELEEVSPIEITLPADGRQPGEMVPIRLDSSVTEVGTLLLEAVPVKQKSTSERWKIELSVRGDSAAS